VLVTAEADVARALTERLLAALAATREQLERARARLRVELGGG
jgi:hypothetical protein